MRMPRPAFRRNGRPWPSLTAGGALGCALAFLAIRYCCPLVGARDAFRSAEQQADARATTLAAIAEQDIRRNLELLDVSLLATMARLELPASPNSAALQHDRALFEHLPRDQYNFFTEALDQKGDVIAGSPPPPSEHGENWAGTEYFTTLRLAGSVG